MSLEARKISFVQEFLKVQNEDIVKSLEKLLHKAQAKANDKRFSPMSIKEFHARIEKSLEDSKAGRLISQEELDKEMKDWI